LDNCLQSITNIFVIDEQVNHDKQNTNMFKLFDLGLYQISAPAPAGIRHFFQIRLRQKSHRSRIVLPDLII